MNDISGYSLKTDKEISENTVNTSNIIKTIQITNNLGTNTSGTNTSGTNTSGTNTPGPNTPRTNTPGTNTPV